MTRNRTRTAEVILDLILRTAREDDRIRAVVLNGSRVNPRAKADAFQDYDVVYVVTDVEAFIGEPDWIRRFGRIMILQKPDDMGASAVVRDPAVPRMRYCWLAQFQDGNRIDLTIVHVGHPDPLLTDSLRVLLLDKDGLFPPFPEPDDRSFHVAPPTAKQYDDCCNELLWVSPYVAKGLWRGEPTYARYAMESLVRPQLMNMLSWHAGMKNGFAVSIGSYAKYLRNHLDPALWRMLTRTWPDGDPDRVWDALLVAGRLFRRAAVEVGEGLGFAYPEEDHRRVTAFLRHIRALPRDAERIFE